MTGVTRDRLLARQRRAAVVAARFEAACIDVAAGVPTRIAELRCEQPHRGGRRLVLAELYVTEQGMLFVSRIEWLPSDHLNRRPWEAESLLLKDRTLSVVRTVTLGLTGGLGLALTLGLTGALPGGG